MDGSQTKMKNSGKGSIHAKGKEAPKGKSMTDHMKNVKPTETERHRTFHGHAASQRKANG